MQSAIYHQPRADALDDLDVDEARHVGRDPERALPQRRQVGIVLDPGRDSAASRSAAGSAGRCGAAREDRARPGSWTGQLLRRAALTGIGIPTTRQRSSASVRAACVALGTATGAPARQPGRPGRREARSTAARAGRRRSPARPHAGTRVSARQAPRARRPREGEQTRRPASARLAAAGPPVRPRNPAAPAADGVGDGAARHARQPGELAGSSRRAASAPRAAPVARPKQE